MDNYHGSAHSPFADDSNDFDQYPLPSADIRSTPKDFAFLPLRCCIALTRRGTSCRMRPMRDSDYCVSHDPRVDANAASERAWKVSAAARRKPAQLLEAVLTLSSRVGIQAFLDIIIRLHFAGHLTDAQAKVALRAASIASHNFDRAQVTLLGPQPQIHEWGSYIDTVQDGLSSIEAVLPPPAADAEDEAAPGE